MKVFALIFVLALGACETIAVTVRQPISVITVSADLDVLPAGAPDYWARLGGDLQTELARRLVDDISNKGGVLLVDIDEASLAAAWQSGFAADMAGLTAVVTLTGADGQVLFHQRLGVQPGMAADATVSSYAPGSSEYYAALIRTFAERVVAAINSPGS